ncbi:MAG: NAD(P)H-hydrate dehydratase [Deltaproteobacteria bacterium]|jgi:NAD(P)H-hydrate epimerase|nr:NAD(P)H-hydrate dehydratase [Deltaproteobacteria bacterium]
MRQNLYIATSAESRELDRVAMVDYGLAGLVLMETAARSIWREALDFWPDLKTEARRILVLAGPGQNGGDGWVLARLFSSAGHKVECRLVRKPGANPSGDAAPNHALARRLGIPVSVMESDQDPLPRFSDYDLVVDALFGTGLDRPLSGQAARALVEAANYPRTFRVLAADLPSGLSGDTGAAGPEVLRADLTVTLGTYKWGLFLGRGPELSGEVRLGDIGLCPQMTARAEPRARLTDAALARTFAPPRPPAGHKGTFGHALIIGGSPGKSGALALAALGAQRSGCGLITAAHPAALAHVMETKLTSAMTLALPEDSPGALSEKAAPEVREFMSRPGAKAAALGPGLGLGEARKKLVLDLAAGLDGPLVLDADALTLLAGDPGVLARSPAPRILTPHPGEAGRLLSVSAGEVEADRPGSVRKLAALTGAVVLLKGRRTLVCGPEGSVLMNSTGGPALATGGSGDLLTGIVAGLLAQGAPPLEAAALGAWLHGAAADLASSGTGGRGVLPTEIQARLPEAWGRLLGRTGA